MIGVTHEKQLKQILNSLEAIDDEIRNGYAEQGSLQTAVYCQKIINTIVWRLNEVLLGTDTDDYIDAQIHIFCKDCKWYDAKTGAEVCHNPRFGDGWGYYFPPYIEEDGFCSWAERKEE